MIGVNEKAKNFIEVLDFGFKMTSGLTAAMADKKFEMTDIVYFIPAFTAFPAAVEGWQDIGDEFKQMTDEGKAEVFAFVDATFPNLGDDVTEELIVDTVKWVIGGITLGLKWADKASKDEAPAIFLPVPEDVGVTEKE